MGNVEKLPSEPKRTTCSQNLHIHLTKLNKRKELCFFSDASTKAIGAIAFLKANQTDGNVEVGFVMGKAKLAPLSEPTIPRLELCAAILSAEMADLIQNELDLNFDAVHFYTDSKLVLGYICSQKGFTHMFTTEYSAFASHQARIVALCAHRGKSTRPCI